MEIQTPEPLYFARMDDGSRILLKSVERVSISDDAQFILHPSVRSSLGWTVTEVSSGLRISTAATSEEAVRLARMRAQLLIHSGSSAEEEIEEDTGSLGLVPAHP